jgi:hypothetical protein
MRTIAFLLALLAFLPAESQARELRISLITCGTGDPIYSFYGHSALRVQNLAEGADTIYNYGVFEFDTPHFTWKFMRGKLLYKIETQTYAGFYREYDYEQRWVVENELLLDDRDKEALLELLHINMQAENRYYPYDFFYDNCSTRIRDLLERLLGERLTYHFPEETGQTSYRKWLDPYIGHSPWLDFGINLLLGAPADARADGRGEMYLPDQLMDNLAYARVDGSDPLLGPTIRLLDLPKRERPKPTPWPLIASSLLFGLLLIPWRGAQKAGAAVWLLFGLFGIVITFMWFATDHEATKFNANLLWLNPLQLIPGVALLRGSQANWLKWFGWAQLAAIPMAFLPPQMPPMAAIPLALLAALLSWRLIRGK